MKVLLLIVCLWICCYGHSQRVRVGEKVPSFVLQQVMNAKDSVLHLDSLRGKLVILDFWSTTCTVCIAAFPKIDSLQKEFGHAVQFIAVNSESEDYTNTFLAKRKNIHLPAVPFIMGDTVLAKAFPRNYAPWHVWIDQEGVVRYITDGKNATAKNIRQFLAGRPPSLEQLIYKYRL